MMTVTCVRNHASKVGGLNQAQIEGGARERAWEGSGEEALWAPPQIFGNFELQIVQFGVNYSWKGNFEIIDFSKKT